MKKRPSRRTDAWQNGCFRKRMIIWFTPNHHPPKMDVHPKKNLQIILAAKCLVRQSSTVHSPNSSDDLLPSLLSVSSSMLTKKLMLVNAPDINSDLSWSVLWNLASKVGSQYTFLQTFTSVSEPEPPGAATFRKASEPEPIFCRSELRAGAPTPAVQGNNAHEKIKIFLY